MGGAPVADLLSAQNIPQFNEPKPNPANYNSPQEVDIAIKDWEKRRDVALENYKKFQEQTGAKSAEAFADVEKDFVTFTDPRELKKTEENSIKLNQWLSRWGENPRVLEILSKPTFANAVADALQQGINTPIGGVTIPGIERIVQAGMPGLKGDEVTALKQLTAILGPRIFQIVKQSKGNTSDKDWNAYTQIAGNSNTGYDFLNKIVKYDKASVKMDKEDRALYNSMIKPNQPTDYRMFASHPDRNKIYDDYLKEVERISAMKHEKQKIPPKPAGMPTNVPAQWSPSTQSYWIGNTQYKVNK